MILDELLKRPGSWLARGRSRDEGIIISSRVRLARNVKGAAFPGWAGKEECVRLCSRLRGVIQSLPGLTDSVFLDMGATNPVDKDLLLERHLISNELADKGPGSGVVVTTDESVAVMINEEDHLRIQAIAPGMKLQAVWRTVDAIDTAIEKHVDYAFLPELGYLTACPSNVGTGLRASVMMHLSGLRLLNEIDPVIKGLERLGMTARGLYGEGTEAHGNMFQISNQSTLGESEGDIMRRFALIVDDVVRHETNARGRLMESGRAILLDHVGRSIGVATHARVLRSGEAMDLLSGLRHGVELGLIRHLNVARINEIMLLTQPAHLQKIVGKLLESEDRDAMRSDMIRQRLKGVSMVE